MNIHFTLSTELVSKSLFRTIQIFISYIVYVQKNVEHGELYQRFIRSGITKSTQFVFREILVLDWCWCFAWIHSFIQFSIHILPRLP